MSNQTKKDRERNQKKKDWEKPELIVISEFNIEQTVLNASSGGGGETPPWMQQ